MAIFTPRGLKIRFPIPFAFALMARLHPRVNAFRVLKTTEGIESIPGLVAFLVGAIFLSEGEAPLRVGIAALVAYSAGALINYFGAYIVPGLVPLATLFSYVSGYGILLVVLLLVGFIYSGWQGLLAFFLGKGVGFLFAQILDARFAVSSAAAFGFAFTASERSFINAYRLHASRLGLTTDIDVSDSELHEANWYPTFVQLSSEWPEVVARFTVEEGASPNTAAQPDSYAAG